MGMSELQKRGEYPEIEVQSSLIKGITDTKITCLERA